MSRRLSVVVAFVVAVGVVFSAAQITSGSTNSTKETVFVGIVPTRLLDTRENATTFDGFDQAVGRLDADTTYELDIASRAGIPIDASSVTANFVAVNPSGRGYLTVYPCSVDRPLAAAVNYRPGEDIGNEFTVPLGPDGDICLYTFAETDLVVDVSGYYITSSGGTGEQGPAGQDGADGADGADGQDAVSPARVIWVAESGGDFTSLSEAMASIPDNNTAATPYVIKIAPGTYTETSNVAMKNYVDVEGSGQGITTVTCALCSGSDSDDSVSGSTISIGEVNTEIRQITIENTGSPFGYAIHSNQNSNLTWSVSVADVTATATGATTRATGIDAKNSTLKLRNVTATASNGASNYGIKTSASTVTIETTVAKASGGTTTNKAISIQTNSSAALNNVVAEATGLSNSNLETTGIDVASSVLVANNTTASAASGDTPTGIYVSGSVVDISNSTATGSGSAVNTGIGVTGGSQATINDVTATGSGVDGNTSRGIAVDGTNTVLKAFNTKARGSTGENGSGAVISTGAEASFSNSVLDGKGTSNQTGNSISNAGTANIVNTRFEPAAPPNDGGTFKCKSNYLLDLTATDPACP